MTAGKSIATTFLTMGLVALAGSLSRSNEFTWPQWAFALFFVLFRVKMYLDDLRFLTKNTRNDWRFKAGFLVGVVSWFFWLLGALQLENLARTVPFLGIAVFLSTVWLVIEDFPTRLKDSHRFWILVNTAILIPMVCRSTYGHWIIAEWERYLSA